MADQISDEAKQEARVQAQQYADLQGTEYVDPYPEIADLNKPNLNKPNLNTPNPNPDEEELSNEAIIALLNKKGIAVANLDELMPQPTAEEIAAEAAKKESEMLAYGLGTGKFKKEEYDGYQLAQTNKLGIAKEEIALEMAEKFPELSAEAVAEKIAQYTFEHLDETDPLRQRREQELITLTDIKLKDKYKNIVNLASDFDQHQQGLTNKTNKEQKIKAALPVYQADLTKALEGLQNIQVPVNDTKNPANNVTIPVKFSDTDIAEMKDAFLQPDLIIQKLNEGYTLEQLQGETKAAMIVKHWDRILVQYAKDYNSVQKENYLQARKGLKTPIDTDISSDLNNDNPNAEVYRQLQEGGTSNISKQHA